MTTLDPIITRVAHTGTNELRFRGRRVFRELLGRTSVGQMLVLGVSGRLLDEAQSAMIDDIVTAMSSADPRMWPFKITRLASSFGAAALGTAATLIAAEGGMFGPNRMLASATWLVELARSANGSTLSDQAILDAIDRDAAGFGVLYRARDERFEALMRQAEHRGRHDLPFTRLCLRAVDVGRVHRGIEPHVFLGVAALCLDLGLEPDAVAAMATVLLFHDALANAIEGARQQPAVLQAVPREHVSYRGIGPRRSPRADSARPPAVSGGDEHAK